MHQLGMPTLRIKPFWVQHEKEIIFSGNPEDEIKPYFTQLAPKFPSNLCLQFFFIIAAFSACKC